MDDALLNQFDERMTKVQTLEVKLSEKDILLKEKIQELERANELIAKYRDRIIKFNQGLNQGMSNKSFKVYEEIKNNSSLTESFQNNTSSQMDLSSTNPSDMESTQIKISTQIEPPRGRIIKLHPTESKKRKRLSKDEMKEESKSPEKEKEKKNKSKSKTKTNQENTSRKITKPEEGLGVFIWDAIIDLFKNSEQNMVTEQDILTAGFTSVFQTPLFTREDLNDYFTSRSTKASSKEANNSSKIDSSKIGGTITATPKSMTIRQTCIGNKSQWLVVLPQWLNEEMVQPSSNSNYNLSKV